jgi:hypothetical protein
MLDRKAVGSGVVTSKGTYTRLCTASFLFCATLLIFWVRSYGVGEYLTLEGTHLQVEISSESGSIQYTVGLAENQAGLTYTAIAGPEGYHAHALPAGLWGRWQVNPSDGSPGRIPFWLPTLLTGILPAAWLLRFGWPKWPAKVWPWLIALLPLELQIWTLHLQEDHTEIFVAFGRSFLISPVVLLLWDRLKLILPSPKGPWPWQFRLKRQVARRALGLCVNCGYDVRANSGRCSECGVEITGVENI